MLGIRGTLAAAVIAAVLVAPRPAAADESPQALYDQGLADMLADRYQSGCPKLEKSYQLDSQPGALFTLAACYARWGKVHTSVQRYEQFLLIVGKLPPAQAAEQGERTKNAIDKVAELRPLIPSLTLVLEGAPAGTRVDLDGEEVSASLLGLPRPLDPGEHLVRVSLGSEAKEQTVTVAQGQSAKLQLELPSARPDAVGEPPPDDAPASGGMSTMRLTSFVLGGVGVGAIVAGSVTGGLVFAKKSDVEDNCVELVCNQAGKDAADDAATLGTASTVTFAIGGAAVAAAVALFVLDLRSEPETEASAGLRVGPSSVGVAW